MESEDLDYYERRAEAELDLARNASEPKVVKAHYELANAYLDLIHGEPDPRDA
jgi:hypothetical protein